jgi:hypothetical protein
MPVSDNYSFSLLDVMVEFGEWTKVPRQQLAETGLDSLADCFNSNNYNADGFDNIYGNPTSSPNTLREFRGYDHNASPFVPTVSISTLSTIDTAAAVNNVNITSNTSWTLGISYNSTSGWATLSSTSGTGDNEDPTITFTSNGNRNNPNPERSLVLTVTTTHPNTNNNTSDSITITQLAFDGGGSEP